MKNNRLNQPGIQSSGGIPVQTPFWYYPVIVIGSYLLGSLSLSVILSGSIFGKDIRSMGSGNAGATNMARMFGWSAGLLTLAGDAAKAVIAMLVGNALAGDIGLSLAAAGCIVGHCFPIFHNFKGGKGISVGGAIAFGLDWRLGVIVVASFLIVALLSKKVSLGSVAAAVTITVASILLHLSLPKILCAIFCMCVAILRHRANIGRLIDGTEPDFKAGKDKKLRRDE